LNVHLLYLCYNRATVSALCLVVLLITFLMFYCVLWKYLSELNVCMYVCIIIVGCVTFDKIGEPSGVIFVWQYCFILVQMYFTSKHFSFVQFSFWDICYYSVPVLVLETLIISIQIIIGKQSILFRFWNFQCIISVKNRQNW